MAVGQNNQNYGYSLAFKSEASEVKFMYRRTKYRFRVIHSGPLTIFLGCLAPEV